MRGILTQSFLRKSPALLAVVSSVLLLSACATKSTTPSAGADPRDPLESVNRGFWTINYDYLDPYLLRPATVGYMTVTPKPVRSGLASMVNNLDEPANMLNALLQGKPKSSVISASRFLVNSTLGVLGFFDVATRFDIPQQNEDFSQTLGVWGLGHGPYLMVPGMGPTTLRDTTGRIVDNLYFPMHLLNTPLTIGKFAIGVLDSREQLMPQEQMLKDSLDPYVFVRDIYFQRQDHKQYDGNPPAAEVDEDALDNFLEQ